MVKEKKHMTKLPPPALTLRELSYLAAILKTLPLPVREKNIAINHFARALKLTNPEAFSVAAFLDSAGFTVIEGLTPEEVAEIAAKVGIKIGKIADV
jgi:hypothetical protein